MEIKISKATLKDEAVLNKLFCSLAKYNSAHIKVQEKKLHDRLSDVEMALKNKDGIIFIAKAGDDVAGYVYVYEVENPSHVVIEHLLVEEKFRGGGIGDKLIKEAEKWGKKKGRKLAEIEVFEWNKPALEFYEHEGFEEDSLMLTKKI